MDSPSEIVARLRTDSRKYGTKEQHALMDKAAAAIEQLQQERDSLLKGFDADGATAAERCCGSIKAALLQRAEVAEDAIERWKADEALWKEREAELLQRIHDDNSICLCGCPAADHEIVDEGAESCGHDDHECLRVPLAVAEIFKRLRSQLAQAQGERIALFLDGYDAGWRDRHCGSGRQPQLRWELSKWNPVTS